jgi:hypothetical protein
MRALIAVLVASFLCSGCYVWDELGKGEEIMDQHFSNSGKNQHKTEAQQRAEQRKAEVPTPREKMAEWWEKAKTLGPLAEQEGDDGIVYCDLGQESRFVRRSDCATLGGRENDPAWAKSHP